MWDDGRERFFLMIVVFGSINMDINMRVKNFPRPGETLLSPSYDMTPGGKGANQALACARGGAKTALIGKIGDDGMGNRILTGLRRNEVMTSGVATSDVLPTGLAFVMRNGTGENQIVVASGANADVSASQVPDEVLKEGNILLLQMEVPIQENFLLMERAKNLGAKIILNLAPAFHIPQKMLELADYLIVNELEAKTMAEVIGISPNQDLMVLARALSAKGGLDCIVTLGKDGAIAMTQKGEGWRVPALNIEQVVDTTGAGTFAAALHSRFAIGTAMRRASVAGGLSCTKKGAQESYPYIAEIEEALESFPQTQPC
jgi:ribokinase